MFRNDTLRSVSTNTPAHVYKHSRRSATDTFRLIFSGSVRAGESGDMRDRSCDLPGFTFLLTKMLSGIPHQRTSTEANAEDNGIEAEHKQIPKFGCSAVWSDERRQNFRGDLLRRALLADAVVACSLSNSELIRERRARRGLAASRRKSFTGILGGVTDQNILGEIIFVWMHFFLASSANIRILHNANSRQTRKKEREGRCMEDATIN